MTRTLIRGATLVTMEPAHGEFIGDLLIEGERIAEIAPHIDAPDAAHIDARGFIVAPGFINAHMHTWQTALRGVAAGWTLTGYFREMHAGLATRCAGRCPYRHARRRMEPARLRHDHAGRLVPQ